MFATVAISSASVLAGGFSMADVFSIVLVRPFFSKRFILVIWARSTRLSSLVRWSFLTGERLALRADAFYPPAEGPRRSGLYCDGPRGSVRRSRHCTLAAIGPRTGMRQMPNTRELDRSANGDTWFLGRQPTNGRASSFINRTLRQAAGFLIDLVDVPQQHGQRTGASGAAASDRNACRRPALRGP